MKACRVPKDGGRRTGLTHSGKPPIPTHSSPSIAVRDDRMIVNMR